METPWDALLATTPPCGRNSGVGVHTAPHLAAAAAAVSTASMLTASNLANNGASSSSNNNSSSNGNIGGGTASHSGGAPVSDGGNMVVGSVQSSSQAPLPAPAYLTATPITAAALTPPSEINVGTAQLTTLYPPTHYATSSSGAVTAAGNSAATASNPNLTTLTELTAITTCHMTRLCSRTSRAY